MEKKLKILNLKNLSKNEIVKKVNNIQNKYKTKRLRKRNKDIPNIFIPKGNYNLF